MKNKILLFTFMFFASFLAADKVYADCTAGESCIVRNSYDGVVSPTSTHHLFLRERIQAACDAPGDDVITWSLASGPGNTVVERNGMMVNAHLITLAREAGSLTIPSGCNGSVTIQAPTSGPGSIPVIIDASAFNDSSTCAITINKNGSGFRNIEVRGSKNAICVNGNDVSVSNNVLVGYNGTGVTFNSSNSQFVSNTLGAYPDRLSDETQGLGQIGFFGIGSGNEIRENTIKYNRNGAIGVLAGSGNRFISNIIAQNNIGISLVAGVNGGIEPPVVNSACAERSAGGVCGSWNVSVTGRAGATAEIFLVDSCWPDASSDASCTDNGGRGKGEAQAILARNILLNTDDPLAGCVAVGAGRVRCTRTIADRDLLRTGTEKITAIQTSSDGSSEFGINIPLNNTVIVIPDIGFGIECLLRGTCGVPPSATGTCGDRIVNQDSEVCDGERGCSSTCQALPNWSCTRLDPDSSGNVHSFCVQTTLPLCGDRVVNQDREVCDGEAGCSDNCEAITGWTCTRNVPNASGEIHSTCTPPVTPMCGNGVCDASETAATCLADCTPRTGCNFNNTCELGETATTCGHDCTGVVTPTCNRNGTCEAGETHANCESDCVVVPECNRDGICNSPSETVSNCASDCTGTTATCNRNGVCDAGETNINCALDCPVTSTCNHNGVCDAAAGENSSTCAADCSVTPPPPSGFNAPTGLTAQPAPNQVTLTFTDNSTTEEGYRVTRASGECSNASTFTTVGTIPSAHPETTGVITYIDTVAVYNGTYCYRVTGYQGNNSTPFAQTQVTVSGGTVDPGINPLPGDPTGMQGSGCSLVGGASNSSALFSFGFGLMLLVGFRRRLQN